LDAFFETYSQTYNTDTLNLNALIACFPPDWQAHFWYESDNGKRSFTTYDEFKSAFQARFGHNAADEARYQEVFLHFKQERNETANSYYTRYLQLLSEMAAMGKPVKPAKWQITKFIDGMRDELKRKVRRIYRPAPNFSLEYVMSDAEMEEPNLNRNIFLSHPK
jgi:hypothetical protein